VGNCPQLFYLCNSSVTGILVQMIHMKRVIVLFLLMGSCYIARAGDEKNVVPSSLKSAIVYRSGAELSHSATAQLVQGSSDVIIENISNSIDINSIQVNVPAAVTIMGVEFSNDYLTEAIKTPRMKLLEDSAETITKEISRIDMQLTNTGELLQVLKANKEIKGTQTGLSVAELMKLMDYYKVKSAELQQEIYTLQQKREKAALLLYKIQEQVREEAKKNTAVSGRLILQVSTAVAGKYEFGISYVARNAYWTPFYDVRVDDVKSPMKVIYRAKIVQTTGIDWKKVKLSLSTSLPTQWSTAPVFQSWFLSYINPVVVMQRNLASNSIQSFDHMEEAVVVGYGSAKQKENKLYIVDGKQMEEEEFQKINSNAFKKVDVLKNASATAIYGARGANGVVVATLKDGLDDYVSVADNSLNVSFDIDMPYDVPSNGKEQTATLKTFEMPALYKHYAVPKLDRDAYLLAELPDWENLNLLPGNANIIFEGTYVGKSFIDPNSTQDTINLTLGKDRRVVIKRDKLIDFSSVKLLGSNKQQKITYEITVKNNKKEPVEMLLKDQFPLSTNKEITVELTESGNAEVNNELGILNWQLKLAPGESKKVRFSYSVKYPKDKVINLQ
jgi:TonB-dependent SusC/RagA subfamily outer membrane receptor